jgi:carbonic anhydrase/acetyltransferase-like protein (isoleucine patch superfamily)
MTKNIRSYQGFVPRIGEGCYLDPSAVVVGDVIIGADSSVWPGAVIRGDVNHIRIGARTSVQDGSVLHVTHKRDSLPEGWPLIVGDDVTIGHKVTLHGCELRNRILVGIGSTLLDGVVVEDDVMIGAGTLVPPGKVLQSGYLYIGSPCKQVRKLSTEEIAMLPYQAAHYVKVKNHYLQDMTG